MSGTTMGLEAMGQGSDTNLIGQFGVDGMPHAVFLRSLGTGAKSGVTIGLAAMVDGSGTSLIG